MANLNMNKVILGGRLTEDPELRTTPGGKTVVSFTMAVNRRNAKDEQERTDFFKCTAWNKTAEFIAKFFRKASSILVVGEQHNKNWVDDKGVKRFGSEVVVDEVFFVDGKQAAAGYPSGAATGYEAGGYGDPRYDPELGF